MFKKAKRILSCALATCGIVACAGTLTACETKRPEVQMKIEFNEKTYTLNYTLYRQITPQTVNHFLWLVDGGYYNDTVIHDYDASGSKMYAGLYDYVKDSEGDYYSEDKSYKDFCEKYKDAYTPSVFLGEGVNPLYTVYGEFKNNNFTVTNGYVKESYGSLTMYYHAKETEETVYVKRAGKGDSKYIARNYEKNSATSMFYISLSNTTKTQNDYCTFATLQDGSKETLKDLQQAIADYIEEHYSTESDDFVTPTTMYVDREDHFMGNQDRTVEFDIPNEPIIIKSVKVTKY